MKNVKRFYVLIGLISAVVMLGLPLGAQAYGYTGSDSDDTIYFGYCETCYHGGPGLLICHVRDGALWLRLPVEMDTGVLTIHGGDDVIDGGSGRDTFRCRSAASAIPLYDGGDAFTDCGDTTPPVSIEVTQRRDPYQEWAYMTEHRNQITCHYLVQTSMKR